MQNASSPTQFTWISLADPTRRSILERLSHGEARVTELARPYSMSLNAVSKHIRVLERAHLIRRRRAGREHFLSFNPDPLTGAAVWMEAQRSHWMSRLDALDALLQAQDTTLPKASKGKDKSR